MTFKWRIQYIIPIGAELARFETGVFEIPVGTRPESFVSAQVPGARTVNANVIWTEWMERID